METFDNMDNQNNQESNSLSDYKEKQKDNATLSSKETSYTYWVDKEKQNNVNVAKKEPQKLDPAKISYNENKHISNWNQIGTWEEKKIDIMQAKQLLQQAIQTRKIQSKDSHIHFYSVGNVSGEISLVTVRGKKKLGYNLQIELSYKGIDKYQNAEGTFKYTSFTDDGDRIFVVDSKNKNFKEICIKSAQNSNDVIENFIIVALAKLHE